MSHRHCIEIYLRLTWPFIVGQLLLMYFLVGTSQGYEIVLASTDTLLGIVIFIPSCIVFSYLVWALTRTVISVTKNRLYQLATNEDQDGSQGRRAGFYCFHLPCYTSVLLLVGLGGWLTFYSGKIWALPAFGQYAAVLCRLWWHQRLGYLKYVRKIIVISAPVLFVLAAFFPVTAAYAVGALGSYKIVFLGFLFLMVFAAVLLTRPYPLFYVVSLFLVLWLVPIVIGLVWEIEPHKIRCVEKCGPIPKFPVPIDKAVERWNARQQPSRTMVVVAAAGGGVRAAYWTAGVLGAIQDRSIKDRSTDSFARHLFAISGVSGGALGGAAFAALGAHPPTCKVDGAQNHSFQKCLSTFLSYDFLGPVMASALTGDLLQVATEIPALLRIPVVDRGAALERSWETAWGRTFPGTNRMEEPFDELWPSDGSFRTNLLLNGTIADAGKPNPEKFPELRPGERVVTSNLLLVQHDAKETPVANPVERRQIALSTAIDNSTRFPFVEPMGAVPPVNPQSSGDAPTYYIADGGYYDNYGAATLLDLLYLLDQQAREAKLPIDRLIIDRLIIVQISSDSEVSFKLDQPLAPKSAAANGCGAKEEAGSSADEILTPYRTAMAAREWSGLSYALQLRGLEDPAKPGEPKTREIFINTKINYFHFGLHGIDPPLGWSLSEISRGCIDGLLDPNSYVGQKIGELVGLLNKP